MKHTKDKTLYQYSVPYHLIPGTVEPYGTDRTVIWRVLASYIRRSSHKATYEVYLNISRVILLVMVEMARVVRCALGAMYLY